MNERGGQSSFRRQDPLHNPFVRPLRFVDELVEPALEGTSFEPIKGAARQDVHGRVALVGGGPMTGFSAEDCLCVTSRGERVLHFFGQPLAVSAQAEAREAARLWAELYAGLLRHLGRPPVPIRTNAPTSVYGMPLYDFVSLIIPFRRAFVFETNCERGSDIVFKYRLETAAGVLSSTQTDGASSFGRVDRRGEGKTVSTVNLADVLSLEVAVVTRIAELITHKKGPPLSLRMLGLREGTQHAAILVRGVDLDIVILTDVADCSSVLELPEDRLADLFLLGCRHAVDRIAYIKAADAVRSQVRHALSQAHAQSSTQVGRLMEYWHDLEALPGIDESVLPQLKKLSQQTNLVSRRIEDVGENPFDVFGSSVRHNTIRASLSVYYADRESRVVFDVVEVVEELVAALDKSLRPDLSVSATRRCVKSDWTALRACLAELLENAKKYGSGKRRAELQVLDGEKAGTLVLRVVNAGLQIGQSEWRHLQDYGIRGREALKAGQEGTGGGLTMVRDTARDLGVEFGFAPLDLEGWPKKRTFASSLTFPAKLVS